MLLHMLLVLLGLLIIAFIDDIKATGQDTSSPENIWNHLKVRSSVYLWQNLILQ